jgi:RNA methyltransferase, TrmH family
MEPISKAKIKHYRTLHDRKGRLEHGLFMVEGYKMCQEALASGWDVEAIVCDDPSFLVPEGVKAFSAKTDELRQVSSLTNPEGCIAVVRIPEGGLHQRRAQLPAGPAFLLDGIQDPGNMGTILRIADWYGFTALVCKAGTVDVFNPKVLRASMGAIFRVQVLYVEAFEELVAKAAEQISVADMEGLPLPDPGFQNRPYVLLGNESHGISAPIRSIAGLTRVTIPRVGGAESLNVAVTAGIFAHEWQRKRD